MHPTLELILNAVYVLAKKKQNGDTDFLLQLAHTTASYLLKGEDFLDRHRRQAVPKFFLREVLPRIKKLGLKAEGEKEVLSLLAARFLGAHALRFDLKSEVKWEDLDTLSAFNSKLLREARAMSG